MQQGACSPARNACVARLLSGITGLLGKPIVNVENACASSSSAFHLAWITVASGQCDVALAIGAEKMSNEDRTIPMKALEAAADLKELEELKVRIAPDGTGTGSVFMDLYADVARNYMERTGARAEDFAGISVKQRQAGALNPHAQFRKAVSTEDVLASKMIADPLRLFHVLIHWRWCGCSRVDEC